jgi:hypothetical protein
LLNLIISIKIDVRKHIKDRVIEDCTPQYFFCNKDNFNTISGNFAKVEELDLSKAYLEAAHDLDFISDEVYARLLNVSSFSRKMAMGAMARSKSIENYDRFGNLIDKTVDKDETLVKVWKNICGETDKRMMELIYINSMKYFLFFWVDNIFFKRLGNGYYSYMKIKKKENSLSYFWQRENLLNVKTGDERQFLLRI